MVTGVPCLQQATWVGRVAKVLAGQCGNGCQIQLEMPFVFVFICALMAGARLG